MNSENKLQELTKVVICTIAEKNCIQQVYMLPMLLGIIAATFFCMWYAKRLNITKTKAGIIVMLGSIFVLCTMSLLQKVISYMFGNSQLIMNTVLNNMGRSFAFVPLIGVIVSRILKISWKKVCNLYAYTETIIWGSASLGCLIAGCCRGYPCEWGIYNLETDSYLFPTQIVNAIGLYAIAGLIFQRCKRKKYIPDGKELPMMLVLVGILRFSTEFYMDNRKIVLGLSSLSFDSIFMFLVGAFLWLVLNKRAQ